MSILADYKSESEGSKSGSYLGIKGKTEANQERRGLQPIQTSEVSLNLIEEIDHETGEIITYQETKKGRRVYRTSQENRAERFALKSVVNWLLHSSETSKCMRCKVPNQDVSVKKDVEHKRAFYTGLRRCSFVWTCPVCAAKIAERRRSELVAAIATAKAMGWTVMMMTCTVRHGLGDDVNLMLDQMMNAWRKMTTGRAGKDARKRLKIEGTIRTLEVTYGKSGFHPHFHVLIFSSSRYGDSAFQALFLPLWQDACVKAGLPRPSDEAGLHVDNGEWAANYASKWGLEDEMTKGHMKSSKAEKGMTPWDMLRDILKTDSERSKRLFLVYANAFKGRRQLYWSNGLKAKLAIADFTDSELIAKEEENASDISNLTIDQWRAVMFSRCEASVLDVAERNAEDLPGFLNSLENIYEAAWRLKNPGKHFHKRGSKK